MPERLRTSRPQAAATPPSAAAAGTLSIGALARATGIPIETLRTWEGRYGFPAPERRPSGHRVYPLTVIPRLQRIAEALARGHRAGQVVAASDETLTALLGVTPAPIEATRTLGPDRGAVAEALRAVEALDGAELALGLHREYVRLGPLGFLTGTVGPLLTAVGEAWAARRLQVRHEHFLSERLADLLRLLRLPFEERAAGPLIVLSTLPGEAHGLGLQMAALVLAAAGCRTLSLGTDLPVSQIAEVAREKAARAVAVSISEAGGGTAARKQLARLRSRLPRRIVLLIGGEGAAIERPGIELIRELPALDAWARRLPPAA